MIAQQARLGNITEASLSDSIARFKQSVNSFKKENKINYDIVDFKLNADGEVKDEYFEAALKKALEEQQRQKEINAEDQRQRDEMETAQRMVDEATSDTVEGKDL